MQGMNKTAKALIRDGIDAAIVARSTGLTVDEINKLKDKG